MTSIAKVMLLAVVIGPGTSLACSADPPHLRPTEPIGQTGTGTLSIRIAGFLPSARSGGWTEALRTDVADQSTQIDSVATNGPTRLTLAPGTYTVTYLPPHGYSAVSHSKSGVVVPSDDTAAVAFDVTVAFGALWIVANVLSAPYPQSGGTVSILRTDLEGQTPITVGIPLVPADGYYTVVKLEPGTYTVTYTPPTGYQLAAGGTNPFTGVAVADPDNGPVVSFDVAH